MEEFPQLGLVYTVNHSIHTLYIYSFSEALVR
jgi:hypothetical protein